MTSFATPQRGFVLGKFMPPHQGHVYLCDFARSYVRELTILVCSLASDPIPGELRAAWMRELFPSCRVLWCAEELPQVPEDDPERFWPIWRDVVRRYHPEPVDVVFASEAYGQRLAAEVGAVFAPCDLQRATVPCSGTDVRRDPLGFWPCIPAPVRPYFAKRVCVFGPESSGKTTLAGDLAAYYATVVAPEYGRLYTNIFGTVITAEDLQRIVHGHRAGVRAAARQANRLVIEDSDPVLTTVWSQMLLGHRAEWLDGFDDYADLYLLCDIDIAWVDDGTRYFPMPVDRRRFYNLCRDELVRRGITFVPISGSRDMRRDAAITAIARHIPSMSTPSRFAR